MHLRCPFVFTCCALFRRLAEGKLLTVRAYNQVPTEDDELELPSFLDVDRDVTKEWGYRTSEIVRRKL